jgi:hypothetical protein
MLQRSSVKIFYAKWFHQKATLCKTLNDSECTNHGQ